MGWDTNSIDERTIAAARRVRDGHVPFEMDGIEQPGVYHSPAILSLLLIMYARCGPIFSIVDFGGGLGTHYFQHRRLLAALPKLSINWNVIERPRLLAKMRAGEFETDRLNFFRSLEHADRHISKTSAFVSSGAIQYLEDPFAFLDTVAERFDVIALDRVLSFERDENLIFVQHTSKDHQEVTYPVWCLSRSKLVSHIVSKGFSLIDTFNPEPYEKLSHTGAIFIRS